MSSNFKFGDWVKGVFCSDNNPQRVGIFVRFLKAGRVCQITDGNGKFWESSRRSTVPESMSDEEASLLADRLWLEDNKNVADPGLVAKVSARVQAMREEA